MPSEVDYTDAEFFICIRVEARTGPSSYPLVKFPDGRLEPLTWQEYHAAVEVNLN